MSNFYSTENCYDNPKSCNLDCPDIGHTVSMLSINLLLNFSKSRLHNFQTFQSGRLQSWTDRVTPKIFLGKSFPLGNA